MRGKIGILMVIASMCPPGNTVWGMPAITCKAEVAAPVRVKGDSYKDAIEDVAEKMERISPYQAKIDYRVSLAMTDQDVEYTLLMATSTHPEDKLLGYDYLIDWTLSSAETPSSGFTAYFSGECYRYRNQRLQEYHMQWDSIPFISADGGVQRNGQFVDLLPQSISGELQMMLDDSNYKLSYRSSVSGKRKVSIISASQEVQGYVGRNFELVVDAESGAPISVQNEYNPAQISEQSVRAEYSYAVSGQLQSVADEEALMALYPEVFENYRESNYRIENLTGLPLPGFSFPLISGGRYTYTKGDAFAAPTLVALLDAENAAAQPTMKALRGAVASMPRAVDLLLVFTGSHTDAIEEITGSSNSGEMVMISGKSLARECGTNVFPTILIVDPAGKVANVILGFNNSLAQDVIQSLALVD